MKDLDPLLPCSSLKSLQPLPKSALRSSEQPDKVTVMFHSHKRHLPEPIDSQHATKRRLVDHLNGLSIGSNNPRNTSTTTGINSVFGSFTKEQLQKPLVDPNRVVIQNIDQFLRENPDQLDLITEKVQLDDLRKTGLDKLVISCGLDLKKAWNKLISRYKAKDSNSDPNVDDLIYKLIWDEYLAKYFSLIKYYDPLKLVWQNFTTWLNKRNNHFSDHHIEELNENENKYHYNNNITNEDTDAMMVDDYEMDPLSSREQSLRDGMSSYGSYYTHDDHWNDAAFHNALLQQQQAEMIEDVDDNDIMMED